MEVLNETTQRVAKSFQNDLGKAIERSNKSLDAQSAIRQKILKGQDASKEIEKEISKTQKERDVILRKIEGLKRAGVSFNAEEVLLLEESLGAQESSLETLNEINTTQIANRGLTGNILETAKEYLITLDKSGLAAKLLNGDLDTTQKLALAGEAGLIAIARGALVASDNIANIAKNTGLSYESALKLQGEFAVIALNTDKAFVSSIALNKSFRDLAEQTGIVSGFGGDTLVTMTALTKQLGLGTAEASQLALLARTQGKDTESILENTVETVNAVNRQNGAAISAKAVLNDVATASKAIVVSLGMSPEILAEAATEARALGLSLAQVDAIAGSILDFESSIENELAFQMLTGKEINLDRARQLALSNDLVGLEKEIGENAAITEAFATGNRIQQEASAAALGISREEMANMVYQQELLKLGAEGFVDAYGEQTYQQMQSQSASQKFEDSMVKIQSVIGDVALALAPVIDAVAAIASSSMATYTILGLIAGVSLAKTIGSLTTMAIQMGIISLESITTASALTFGLGAVAIAAGIGLIMSQVQSAKSQKIQDGIAPSSKGPFTITDSYGAMAVTTAGDSLMASPNVGKGGGSDGEMLSVLERIANKNSDVYMDSSKVGYADALSYSKL
jgi:DNA-binding phage protein